MADLQEWAAVAEPVDPEVVARAAEWQREQGARQERERPKPTPEVAPEPELKAPQPVPSVRGGYGHTPVTYQILEEAMTKLVKQGRAERRKVLDGIVEAIVRKFEEVSDTFAEARTKTTWRFEEAERRIAELEARLAKLEGRTDG